MERIDWMLGMTENMMNMTVQIGMDKPLMPEMYSMTSAMMGNLHHMKLMPNKDMSMLGMMEQMMRSMEDMMKTMDMEDMQSKMMMKHMMQYMIMMQMHNINKMMC